MESILLSRLLSRRLSRDLSSVGATPHFHITNPAGTDKVIRPVTDTTTRYVISPAGVRYDFR